ncbi:fructokinase-like 2, chloroplastic [Diospyros lotus]|uniref:fructokinase-like 2, chloroplastic n=1 Tax=Diospyros lotus TaxID=55363 RepID=UPI002251F947|nr:fructokinase-like 2, chloroplastic [Diospyros lotus]
MADAATASFFSIFHRPSFIFNRPIGKPTPWPRKAAQLIGHGMNRPTARGRARRAETVGASMAAADARYRRRRATPQPSLPLPSPFSGSAFPALSIDPLRTSKRRSVRSRRKVKADGPDDDVMSSVNGDATNLENSKPSTTDEKSKKSRQRTRRKAESVSNSLGEEKVEKKVTRRRRTKKKLVDTEDEGREMQLSDREGDSFIENEEDEYDENLGVGKDEEDDISFTYGWPLLVCCFGAVQHAFVPSGRPANRLVDHEMHEKMKDALWTPEKFVRAPGGCASNVAVALAILGGKVALMGKIGDDDYGQSLLYFLNMNNVQTRSVRIDSRRVTAASQMKIGKRGGLKMTCLKPCAEDSLTRSEINIDVLKEAKMFYFNTFSLLDRNMRSTTLQAIKMSKKLGGIIFYDLNLPLPLWQSCEETKMFIQQAWNLADIIEVTKQELEFLCGIKPTENFDTRDNQVPKFVHYTPEVLTQLWHENLTVLFVTNGTSKIHYYTKEHNGVVQGMEDAPLSPFTQDMSASGDGIVAALMRMLIAQPHLITDKGYLEQTIKYAINCGVIDQWALTRTCGFPPKEGMEDDVEPDPNGIRSITEKEYRTRVPVS